MALAVMLGWCLGQRPADLRKLAWSSYDGEAVALRQAKTDTPVWVPCLTALRRCSTRRRASARSSSSARSPDVRIVRATPAPLGGDPRQGRPSGRSAIPRSAPHACDRARRGRLHSRSDQGHHGHKTRSVVSVYVRPDRTSPKARSSGYWTRRSEPERLEGTLRGVQFEELLLGRIA